MTFRVVLLCLALAVFFGYVIPIIDVKLANTFLGAQHLPPGAVGALLVLVLVLNPLMRLIGRGKPGTWLGGFSRNEALTVYISCLFSCIVPGHGSETFVLPNLIAPFYFATRENKWLDFLEPHLRPWLTPALWADKTGQYGPLGKEAVENWYIGGNAPVPWEAWLVPMFAWGTLCVLLYVMLACFSVMLRAQWAEHEALSFPLLRLPLELTEDLDRDDKYGVLGRFFRNPLTWIGFSIAVFIQALNGLNFYFPDVPKFPTDVPTGPMLSEPPWNQIGWVPIQIYPIAIGIAYLLTSEVGFSLWFFYFFIKFQHVAAYYMGWMPNSLPASIGSGGSSGKIFTGYQVVGAAIAYATIVMWIGRAHYLHIAKRAFGRAPRGASESTEMMSYPAAFWGFVLSAAAILAWCVAAGIRIDVAIAMWVLYMVMAIGLTRVLAEGGMLYIGNSWYPLATMAQLTNAGTGTWLTSSTIVPATLVQGGFMTDLRGFLLPSFVHSFKLAHDRGISRRPLLALIAAVTLITLVMGFWMRVKMGYESSGLTFHSWFRQNGAQFPGRFSKQISEGVPDVSWMNWAWMGFGGGLTYLMMLARARLMWFPIHPMGYLVCLTYPMTTLWFSIFVGWLCKVLITRFGGNDTYRKTTPLFLGIALGDVFMMLLWLIIDGWQGRTYHYLVPT